MAGSKKSNYMISFLMKTIKESSGDIFHQCPVSGRVSMINMTMTNEKLFSIYPRGQYRLNVKLSDGANHEMFSVASEIDLINAD